MKRLVVALVFSSFSNIAMAEECNSKKDAAFKNLGEIAKMLSRRELGKIVIRYFSVEFYSRSPLPMWALDANIDQSALNADWYPKEYILEQPAKEAGNLLEVIDKTKIYEVDAPPPDLRRSIKFFDRTNRLKASIYLGVRDDPSLTAYINGTCVGMSVEIYDWISDVVGTLSYRQKKY